LVATVDRRGRERATEQTKLAGIAAFDRSTLEPRWVAWDLPQLAAVVGDTIYAYGRTGVVVAIGKDGRERWRVSIPDDRSPKGQVQGDPDSPFVADVVPAGSAIYLAAQREIWRLDATDGRVTARATVCREPRGVVVRLVQNDDRGLIANCTQRTDWDEGAGDAGPPLQRPPSLESRRTAPGDLVALDFDLREQWRLPSPTTGLTYDHRAPAMLEDGSIACLASRVIEDGHSRYLDLFGGWIFVVDGRTGRIRWLRESGSSHGVAGPVAVQGGVVDGGRLVFYELNDGSVRWEVRADQNGIDPGVGPTPAGERLLVAGRLGIREIDLRTGRLTDLFSIGAHPFTGLIVTPILHDRDDLYVGVEEAGAVKLLAFRLTTPSLSFSM
jgi:outer membrane protein assembly factor BamB